MLILPAKPAIDDLTVQTISQASPGEKHTIALLWNHATRIDAHAIGWLPTAAYEARVASDDIITISRNNEHVGLVMVGKSVSRAVMKLYQIWVRHDARILEHGRALVDEVRKKARQTHCYTIEAWVAEDLPANLFWTAIGFKRHNWRWGRGNKGRKIYRWTIPTIPHGEMTHGRTTN